MKLSRTKPSKVHFTVECQGKVDGPMDVRLVLGKDKKLSLKTESTGKDHVVTIPALVDHPWLMEGETVPATIEIVCEKYYFAPMKKNLDIEPEEHIAPGPTVSATSGPGTQPASANPLIDSMKTEQVTPGIKIEEPVKVVEVKESLKKKTTPKPLIGSILETVTSTEIAKMKKEKQAADLLKALRDKK